MKKLNTLKISIIYSLVMIVLMMITSCMPQQHKEQDAAWNQLELPAVVVGKKAAGAGGFYYVLLDSKNKFTTLYNSGIWYRIGDTIKPLKPYEPNRTFIYEYPIQKEE